jgi:hypothetical protein
MSKRKHSTRSVTKNNMNNNENNQILESSPKNINTKRKYSKNTEILDNDADSNSDGIIQR